MICLRTMRFPRRTRSSRVDVPMIVLHLLAGGVKEHCLLPL